MFGYIEIFRVLIKFRTKIADLEREKNVYRKFMCWKKIRTFIPEFFRDNPFHIANSLRRLTSTISEVMANPSSKDRSKKSLYQVFNFLTQFLTNFKKFGNDFTIFCPSEKPRLFQKQITSMDILSLSGAAELGCCRLVAFFKTIF